MTMLARPGRGRLGRLSQVLRPMISGLPMVMVLKNFRSEDKRHGSLPSFPMTPFLEAATTKARRGLDERLTCASLGLHRDRRGNMGMALVAENLEIFELEVGNVIDIAL